MDQSGPNQTPANGRRPERAKQFNPGTLIPLFITEPLASKLADEQAASATTPGAVPVTYDVIIDINTKYKDGRIGARTAIRAMLAGLGVPPPPETDASADSLARTLPYVFAALTGDQIRTLAQLTRGDAGESPIFRIWEDHEVTGLITHSIATVKADAAHVSFSAVGRGIVWAVLDSGIHAGHVHFQANANLDLPPPLYHRDFTQGGLRPDPPDDPCGHVTHVAGIIAGSVIDDRRPGAPPRIPVITQQRDESNRINFEIDTPRRIAGMAPECKLLSLRVLDANNRGLASSVIQALEYVQTLNDFGRNIVVHGVNLSLGYGFDPEWFACGQSPLCIEVNRLVSSGVCVVVAAGNSGYGYSNTEFTGVWAQGMTMSINDPGNADLAITVGSTHREMPHTYGVSYFSSKGPTGDGRRKPDLLAPGERIVSCAAGAAKTSLQQRAKIAGFEYLEDSGTSMAAPHVSGIIAAFLSIRREYIGKPLDIKDLLLQTATDLRRDPNHQGAGLVDLMRAISSV
jgi:subtilisin family serine protease